LYDDVRDNLYRDFLQRIGLRSDLDYREPAQVNRSLTGDEIEVLRHVNRMGLSRALVAKIVEDFAFSNKHPKRRPVAISRASIDAIANNNDDVIKHVNARLSRGSVLRAASDTVLKHATDTNESPNAEPDPEIMRGLLESGVRVVERWRGKLDQEIVLALRESDSRLRGIADGQSGSDPQTALQLLESGLRLVESRYNAQSFFGIWKMRFQMALRNALNRPEPRLKAALTAERKAQKRLERKKQQKPAAEDAHLHELKLERIRRKKAQGQDPSFTAQAESLLRKRQIRAAQRAQQEPAVGREQERQIRLERKHQREMKRKAESG
jgi:hypothetical protein